MWKLKEELARNGYNFAGEEAASNAAGSGSGGSGGFRVDNADNNIGIRSGVENMGVVASGTNNIRFSKGGSGTYAISGPRGLRLETGNTVGGAIRGNLVRPPGDTENVGLGDMNIDGMLTGFSGDSYSSYRRSRPFGLADSASARTLGIEAVEGPRTGTTGSNFAEATGSLGEAYFGGGGDFR